MEVCGTHTMAIFRHGIRAMLPAHIELLSGPGCPVCVTPTGFVDAAMEISRLPSVIVATFGDMVKVPGTQSTLEKERAKGAEVVVVYSPHDALLLAQKHPKRKVVFLGIGFETTAPLTAAVVSLARREGVENFFVLSAHKLVPPALEALASDAALQIDGFLLPGHVSVVTGTKPYQSLAEHARRPAVVSGFEANDILQSIYMILRQLVEGRAEVENQYVRCVSAEGNPVAQRKIEETFAPVDTEWRGLGTIALSGLAFGQAFASFDAEQVFGIEIGHPPDPPGCSCGDVLRGQKAPPDCPLFAKACTPHTPVGACMVSSEGSCAAYFRYTARSAR